MRVTTILSVAAVAACFSGGPSKSFGQHLSAGVVGGASLTDDFRNESSSVFIPAGPGETGAIGTTHYYSTSKDYIVGAMVELRFPSRLSVEVDGLYRPLNFKYADTGGSQLTVVTWEFPLLVKYQLPYFGAGPFVELGPSFRTSGNRNDTLPSSHGITAGGGVETRLLKLRIAPVLRYTRWAPDQPQVPPRARTNQNQVEPLVGFSF